MLFTRGADHSRIPPAFPLIATLCQHSVVGEISVVETFLCLRKYDVDASGRFGSALHIACFTNDERLIELLLSYGADANPIIAHPEARESLAKKSPLSHLFLGPGEESLKLHILEMLLAKGAFVHWRGVDDSMTSPLVTAVELRLERCAIALIQHGAPIDVRIAGSTLLDKARACRMKTLTKLLTQMDVGIQKSKRRQVLSLFDLSVRSTRHHLSEGTNTSIVNKIKKLTLPARLKADLKLDNFDIY